jgi:hypothetical protein
LEWLENRDDLPDHTSAMIAEGRVIACHIGVDYLDQENMKTIASGLADITDAEGPLLINCSLGRDRTGVICALLEALCGATYDEIVQDYMVSYDCLHSIDMNPDSLQYRLFKARIDELDIVCVHQTPSADGLRVVALCQPQFSTLAENQAWLASEICCGYDAVCKDWARLFFLSVEEDFFYIDWETLFDEEDNNNQSQKTENIYG